jgi:hypothetical protein
MVPGYHFMTERTGEICAVGSKAYKGSNAMKRALGAKPSSGNRCQLRGSCRYAPCSGEPSATGAVVGSGYQAPANMRPYRPSRWATPNPGLWLGQIDSATPLGANFHLYMGSR